MGCRHQTRPGGSRTSTASAKTPARAPQKLRPRQRHETSLVPGQHIVVPVPEIGEVLLRIDSIHEDKGGRCPVALAVSGMGGSAPCGALIDFPPWSSPRAATWGQQAPALSKVRQGSSCWSGRSHSTFGFCQRRSAGILQRSNGRAAGSSRGPPSASGSQAARLPRLRGQPKEVRASSSRGHPDMPRSAPAVPTS